MVRVETASDLPQAAASAIATASSPGLIISLSSLSAGGLETTLGNIAAAFPGEIVLVATPDGSSEGISPHEGINLLLYTPAVVTTKGWLLTAADYVNTYKLAKEHGARACLILGAEAQSLEPAAIKALAAAVFSGGFDLATPRYDLGPREGLVNSAILYPVSRALYGAKPRYPLAIDLGLSIRMAERMAMAGQRITAVSQNEAIIWPVGEASASGFAITEVEAGPRTFLQPTDVDLNTLLAQVSGSLFSDIEAKASFWQRSRTTQPPSSFAGTPAAADAFPDVQPMLASFRLAYTNLHEIWSLVLPPHSLLGLKKLSLMPADTFRMPDALWARTVYDFILAYRLRTLNRGHLLGALTPLYLAWVASHILSAKGGLPPERHIEDVAVAFEADKPYLVSRWRWPDRFNP